MVRVYMDLDDEAELLYIFYKYVIDRCEPQAKTKLQRLLSMLESLADERNREKLRKLKKKVWRQFEDDRIWCEISRNSRRH